VRAEEKHVDLYFLGTGAGAPTGRRNVSALLTRFDQGRALWLFDCGEGTQHQLLRSPYAAAQIRRIFVTHLHGDHLFGLPGLLGSRSLQVKDTGDVTVVGPPGLRQYMDTVLRATQTHLTFAVHIVELEPQSGSTCVFELCVDEESGAHVTYAWLSHGIPCVGYAVTLPPRPGRFDVEAARALGIPEGPLYGRLKRGEQVQLADGRIIAGSDLVASPSAPEKIVILGDTRPCPSAVALAQGADLLVHEATFADAEQKLARQRGHSTNLDAAHTAQSAQVRELVLTHLSARYDDAMERQLLADAREVFAATRLAHDGLALHTQPLLAQ
jgi:ribonuclease Z